MNILNAVALVLTLSFVFPAPVFAQLPGSTRVQAEDLDGVASSIAEMFENAGVLIEFGNAAGTESQLSDGVSFSATLPEESKDGKTVKLGVRSFVTMNSDGVLRVRFDIMDARSGALVAFNKPISRSFKLDASTSQNYEAVLQSSIRSAVNQAYQEALRVAMPSSFLKRVSTFAMNLFLPQAHAETNAAGIITGVISGAMALGFLAFGKVLAFGSTGITFKHYSVMFKKNATGSEFSSKIRAWSGTVLLAIGAVLAYNSYRNFRYGRSLEDFMGGLFSFLGGMVSDEIDRATP